jgi:16S rRNA G966 N2-methylase RsmD
MTAIVPAKGLEAQIRASNDIGELKDIHAKAEAMRGYLQEAGENLILQNQYAEVKIRVERRCGEILDSEIKHGGDRKSDSRLNRQTLKNFKITKYQSHCWQVIFHLPEDAFEGHIAKVKDANEELTAIGVYRAANAYRKLREQDAKPIPGAESVKTPIPIRTIAGHFMDSFDEFDNIDAIITDPPYPKEYLHLYGELAQFSAKVLKPGGSLLAMAGVHYLPQVLERMTPHLNYQWTISYHMPSRQRKEWHRKVLNTWKPILWFVKGNYEGKWIKDYLLAGPIEKTFHPWQQSVAVFEALIDMVTRPGDTIIDPCFGWGTLGEAAIRTNRKFWGIEIDSKTLATAEKRLERVAKKIVLPSYIPNVNPAKVLDEWEKQKNDSGDSDEIKANPTDRPEEQKAVLAEPFEENGTEYIPTDRPGVYKIKLNERKLDQPEEPAASDTVVEESGPEKAKIISSKSKKRKPGPPKKTGPAKAAGRKKAVKRKR